MAILSIDVYALLRYNGIVKKWVQIRRIPGKGLNVRRSIAMPVRYDRLFARMEEKEINKHYLRTHGIHAAVVDKLIKGGTIDTTTISKLCALLDCQPGDIMEYVSGDEPAERGAEDHAGI